MRSSYLLVFAGVAFAAYPALRPYSSETGAAGATAFASPLWIIAHTCAIAGFVALALAVQQSDDVRASGGPAVVATWIGVGLVLPYYGAEVFALNAIGRAAQSNSDPGLLDLADPIRYSVVPLTMFGVGFVALAVGMVAFARHNRAAVVLAIGFVLFLPQFFAPPAVRIAHGLVILIGALIVARTGRSTPARTE